MARPVSNLVATLFRTREVLERMITRLGAEKESSVSDEQRLRRGRRALRKVLHEYLPWATSPALTAAKAAEIMVQVELAWQQLSLKQFEG